MSIKPLDLQTLFVKMAEVGKEQSNVKEQSALQQAHAARAQVARELEDDHKVTSTPEDSEALAVKDDEAETAAGEQKENEERKESDSADKRPKEVVTDPDVGQHIDLTG